VLSIKTLIDSDPKQRRIFAAGAVSDAEGSERLRFGGCGQSEQESYGNVNHQPRRKSASAEILD
jgi:hypothetical protein